MNLKKITTFCALLALFPGITAAVYAASLDDKYSPIISKEDVLLDVKISNYGLEERGKHGSASFGNFSSSPTYDSIGTDVRFSPLENLDVNLGFSTDISTKYDRTTANAAGTSVAFFLVYDLDFMNHMNANIRYRFNEENEVYLKTYNNIQRANWSSSPGMVAPDFFTDIDSHYEHLSLGLRHIENFNSQLNDSRLSRLTYSLFKESQFGFELGIDYKAARMERENIYTVTTPATLREYTNDLSPHVIPHILFIYGINDNLNFESGLSYSSAIRYQYDFKQFNSGGTSNFIQGNYKIKHQLTVPVNVKYRPFDSMEITLSADTTYAEQTLEYHEKELDNSTTQYNGKKLHYVNVNPVLEISYLLNEQENHFQDDLAEYEKPLLAKGEAFLKFKFEKDISVLRKSAFNGTQNLIEYETLFLYPVDNFVSGTEYGLALIGSTSSLSSNARLQNYYTLESSLNYGFTDQLNALIGVGFHSGSAVHQFSFNDLANRYIKVEPYTYFNLGADLQITQNSRLSVDAHIVPYYKSFSNVSVNPNEFEIRTQYYSANASFKILF